MRRGGKKKIDQEALIEYSLKNENASLIILGSFFNRELVSEEQVVSVWTTVVDEISKNSAIAAIASKYMQLIAVLKYPKVYNFDMETILDLCDDEFYRNKRNKCPTPHDFIAENMKSIIKTPTQFVQEKLLESWAPLKIFDLPLKEVKLCP